MERHARRHESRARLLHPRDPSSHPVVAAFRSCPCDRPHARLSLTDPARREDPAPPTLASSPLGGGRGIVIPPLHPEFGQNRRRDSAETKSARACALSTRLEELTPGA